MLKIRNSKIYASDHNGINLETDNGKNTFKSENAWRLNSALLYKMWIKEVLIEIKHMFN
jgi:hypothetical protein